MSDIKTFMNQNGYYVIKGAIPTDEVALFKETIVNYFKNTDNDTVEGNTAQPNAFNKEELFALHKLFSLNSLIGPMRDLLDGDVCFLHNSDVHYNFLALGWHDDTQIRHLAKKPQNYNLFEGSLTNDMPFKAYNIGIYLQDHPDGGALSVFAGSHKNGPGTGDGTDISDRQKIESQAEVNLCVQAGDAVVFDIRTFHHGNIGENKDRATIFFGLGAKNIHSYYSARGSIERQERETRRSYSPCKELQTVLKENNIQL